MVTYVCACSFDFSLIVQTGCVECGLSKRNKEGKMTNNSLQFCGLSVHFSFDKLVHLRLKLLQHKNNIVKLDMNRDNLT